MICLVSILALTSSGVLGAITEDLSCSEQGVYTSTATSCTNSLSDVTCAVFYPESAQGAGLPAAGNSVQRPFKCYSTSDNGGSVNADMKKVAINNCAKTCGMCCLTPAYNCPNAQFPAINCATVTPSQCTSPIWREKIAQNCPAVCGLCNEATGVLMQFLIAPMTSPFAIILTYNHL